MQLSRAKLSAAIQIAAPCGINLFELTKNDRFREVYLVYMLLGDRTGLKVIHHFEVFIEAKTCFLQIINT